MLQALRFASILGSSFTVTDLSVTMDRPVVELFGVLAEGIAGRVLEDDGDRLRFRHDVIRDAIYEDMPATIRHGLHREAGQRLARTGAPALQVAEHLARGAARGDTEAVGWLSRAAHEAAAKSPDVAAALLESGGRADGAGRSGPRPAAGRTGRQPDVGGPGGAVRGGLPGAARTRPRSRGRGCGADLPWLRADGERAAAGRAHRTGARGRLAPAHRGRTVRRPGLGQHRADVAWRPRWLRGHRGRGRSGGREVRGPHDDHDRQFHVRDRVPVPRAAGPGRRS